MSEDTTPPIVINPSALPDQVGVGIRYAVTTIGGYLVGRGYLTNEQVSLIAGLLVAVAPAVYALWQTTQKKKQLVTIVTDPRVPDAVASARK